jgi:CarD family transcriptional regulator
MLLDYQVGQTVIHQQYGIGEIVKIDEQMIHERLMLCYVVRVQNHMTIWVAADDPQYSSLRHPTSEDRFQTLFEILEAPGTPLPLDRLERKINLSERMKEGDLASVCAVIRDLAIRRKEKKLNDDDKSVLERAKNLLLTEWMYVLTVTHNQANLALGQLLKS